MDSYFDLPELPSPTALRGSPAQAIELMAERIGGGKHLIVSAAMAGDRDDFTTWLWRCKEWNSLLADSISDIYGREAARTFAAVANPSAPLGSWQEILRCELDRVREVIEMLDSLAEELRERSQTAL